MSTTEDKLECPVGTTVRLIGSKWKLLILCNLEPGPLRYSELAKNVGDISQKVLTENLRALEEDGIVTRTAYAETPPRVEYALSEVGQSMRPIVWALEDWGRAHRGYRGGADR